jgi:hypothetical protein
MNFLLFLLKPEITHWTHGGQLHRLAACWATPVNAPRGRMTPGSAHKPGGGGSIGESAAGPPPSEYPDVEVLEAGTLWWVICTLRHESDLRP